MFLFCFLFQELQWSSLVVVRNTKAVYICIKRRLSTFASSKTVRCSRKCSALHAYAWRNGNMVTCHPNHDLCNFLESLEVKAICVENPPINASYNRFQLNSRGSRWYMTGLYHHSLLCQWSLDRF